MANNEYLNNRTFENLIVRFQQAKKERTKYQLFVDDIKATEQRTMVRGKYKKPSSWASTEKEYHTVSFQYQEVQNELAEAFYTLSQNIVRYAKFNLIDQDDAVQEGVMICFEKIDRFDPQKGKAFNYMTTCILNHFRQLYRTARNYNELKRKYLDFLQIQLDQQIPPSKAKSIYKKHNIVTDP
jgi:DNA-directed RNA polymerase specialized sigma subunit